MRFILAWITWISVASTYIYFNMDDVTTATEAIYFALSLSSTAGLFAPNSIDPDHIFNAVSILVVTGVPLMSVAVCLCANTLLLDDSNASAMKAIRERVTITELEMMVFFY